MKLIDLTGQRFGRLTALKRSAAPKWLCQCDCGTTVAVNGYSLRHGRSKSCGCLRRNGRMVATYEAAHARVRAAKGPAKDHCCIDCGGPALQWSYNRTDPTPHICGRRDLEYSFNTDCYEPRCSPCHKLFDMRLDGIQRCRSGHEMTPENTYINPAGSPVCRQCKRQRNRDRKRAARRGLVTA